MSTKPIRLGLISAMEQEQKGLIDHMQDVRQVRRGMRDYTCGNLWGVECVCVLSRLGKVAAAATVATLIERFDVTHIVFTGVAGGVAGHVQVGDVVVADALVQHDMDASPLFPRFEVPLLGQSHFASDLHLTDRLAQTASDFLGTDLCDVIKEDDRAAFRLDAPRVHRGLIASGDEFIDSKLRLNELSSALPEVLAVEMEGGAVAQVCFEFGVPFAVIRTISDSANEHAPLDFLRFIERVAARYAFGVVRRLCISMA